MIKTTSWLMLAAAIALCGCAAAAEWPKQEYVQINDVPESELCRETSRAVAELRKEIGWPMTKLYGQGATQPDRTVGKLTFAGLRTSSTTHYQVDIDNTPPVEMIEFVTGGHLATGGGTTLTIRSNDPGGPALVFGPLEVSFTGKAFDAGYYSYPFAFTGKNYLFVEGNGEEYQTSLNE